MTNIINATKILVTPDNEAKIDELTYDLQLLKKGVTQLDQIVIRGGCVLDVLHNLEPNDIDLFYSIKENGKYVTECRCDIIRSLMKHLPFKYFSQKNIDLENSYEKEPMFGPIERTVGLFSFHSDYNSMLALDEEGQIWTNTDTLKYIKDGIYEVNYAGFLPWAYFPQKNDNHHYYSFFCYQLIRGIAHIMKRDLKPGPTFLDIVEHAPLLVPRGIKEVDVRKFHKLAKKKNLTFRKVEDFLTLLPDIENKQLIFKALQALL